MSKFIVQLSQVRKELGLPKRETFFSFEILEDDIKELNNEFGYDMVQKALYKLDRMLLQNKQQCPHNIKKYIRRKLLNKVLKDDKTKERNNIEQ